MLSGAKKLSMITDGSNKNVNSLCNKTRAAKKKNTEVNLVQYLSSRESEVSSSKRVVLVKRKADQSEMHVPLIDSHRTKMRELSHLIRSGQVNTTQGLLDMERINEGKEEFITKVKGHMIDMDEDGNMIQRAIIGSVQEFIDGRLAHKKTHGCRGLIRSMTHSQKSRKRVKMIA